MTTPHASPTDAQATHDFCLSDGSNTYGFIFAGKLDGAYQAGPLSGGSKIFKIEQPTFVSGRGKIDFTQDGTGFTESAGMWTMTDQCLFPALKWRFARGIQAGNFWLSDSMTFLSISGANLYLAQPFLASSAFTPAYLQLWLKRIGTAAITATVNLYADNSGTASITYPAGASLITSATLTTEADVTTYFQKFAAVASVLTSGNAYWITINGGAPTATDYWQIGIDPLTAGGLKSATGTWSTATALTASLCYRIVEADVPKRLYPFYMYGAWYVASKNDSGATSRLWINGFRFKATATGGGATTDATHVGSSTNAMIADRYIGAKVRIIDGLGDGQVRTILDNDTMSLTVATWDITPDATSQVVIYDTEWFQEVTGHGLGAITGPPVVAGNIVYLPQGAAAHTRRISWLAAGSHDYDADGSNHADLLGLTTTTSGTLQMIAFTKATSKFATATTTTSWDDNLTFSSAKSMGTSDYQPTGSIDYQGSLYSFKENGLYSIVSGVPKRLDIGGLETSPYRSNGESSAVLNLYLYFTRANSVIQLLGTNAADIENYRIGYEQLSQVDQGIGTLHSAEGWLFRSIDAGSAGTSRILAWNGYGWHEVLHGYAVGARIRDMFWQPNEGGNSRFWANENGDLVYLQFPVGGSNPLKDSSCRFMHEGVFITPTLHLGEREFYKLYKDVQVISDNLSATSTISVDYQTDSNVGTTTWTALSTALDASPFHTADLNLGATFQLRLRFRFLSTNGTTPPILHSWTVNGNIIEPLKYQWSVICGVMTEGDDLQGNPDTNPDTLEAALVDWSLRRVKLTVSAQKTSLHSKVVVVEPVTVRLSDISTEDGSSKWGGTLWFTLREA